MDPKNVPVSDLLQKYLDGSITEQESTVLFAWLKEHPVENNQELEAILEASYQQSFAEKPALTPVVSQRILNRLLASTELAAKAEIANRAAPVHRVQFLRRSWMRYAAAAVLIIVASGIVLTLLNNDKKADPRVATVPRSVPVEIPSGTSRAVLKLADGTKVFLDSMRGRVVQKDQLIVNNDAGKLNYQGKTASVEFHTLSTPRGGQYNLQLPDGTEVWLNAASSISYPTAFTGNERRVTITGEAYFEVTHNKAKPFIVDINGKGTVQVLGTEFNINAYADEESINATLLDGSIRMVYQQETVILKPRQQARLSDRLKVVEDTNLEMVVAWKNGYFQFDHAHLKDVLRQISRWYDVTVQFEPGAPDIIFSGEIKRDLNLSQALIVLEKMGVHFRIEGKKLIVIP